MSDEELRALERTWRETGAVEDEARWLAARVRAGGLDRARLASLAFFGHEAARLAAELPAPDAWDLDDANEWAARLKPLGAEALLRAGHAVAAASVPEGAARPPMLEAIEAWLACPCAKHAKAATKAVRAREDAPIEVDEEGNEVRVEDRCADVAVHVARALAKPTVASAAQALYYAVREVPREVPRVRLRDSIRSELARWALA